MTKFKVDRDELAKLAEQGLNTYQIAEELGVVRATVYRCADLWGIDVKRPPAKPKSHNNQKWYTIPMGVKDISDSAAKAVACAIITRAVEDYKQINRDMATIGRTRLAVDGSPCTWEELENYFRSELFEAHALLAGFPVSGENIIRKLRKDRVEQARKAESQRLRVLRK